MGSGRRKETHIPRNDNVHKRQLHEPKPTTLVHTILPRALSRRILLVLLLVLVLSAPLAHGDVLAPETLFGRVAPEPRGEALLGAGAGAV